MSGDYILAVKSIGLSKVGGRKPCTLEGAAKHNKRELAPQFEARGRIDGNRSKLNYSIVGAADSARTVELTSQLMEEIGTSPERQRRDYCQAIEIVFSLPPTTTIDTTKYFADCVTWCNERFGSRNILCADVHFDEAAPHCHVLIAPILDGRWMGGKLIDREHTKALRESFGRMVALGYNLRMTDRLSGVRKATAVATVLRHVKERDRGLLESPAWACIRKCIEAQPERFVACYGLELEDKRPAKQKTMAQIFTSQGKGPKRETLRLKKQNPIGILDGRKYTKPIGIEIQTEKIRSLSCVGFAFPKHSIANDSVMHASALDSDSRTVERDGPAQTSDQASAYSPAFASVVSGDDGLTREREFQLMQPDGFDPPSPDW